jgi:hypothetical protein
MVGLGADRTTRQNEPTSPAGVGGMSAYLGSYGDRPIALPF